MKLEVGMYIRYGLKNFIEITKIIDFDKNNSGRIIIENEYGIYDDKVYENATLEKFVKKASYNIIDLIEVGDYVNGVRVDKLISKSDVEICFKYIYAINENDVYTLKSNDIKSILTKEQFSSMEYRID